MAVELLATKDYNPDEPRDDHGRWSGGGITPQAVADVLGDRSMGSVIGPTPRGLGANTPFTSADRSAMQHYVGTEESMSINRSLRDGEKPSRVVKALDRAMNHAGEVGQPVRAYRMTEEQQHVGLEVGQTFTDLGFGSATANADRGDFIERTMTRFTLDISPGVKAVWGANPTEQELVLERGSRYVIESISHEGNRWQIKASVLPPG